MENAFQKLLTKSLFCIYLPKNLSKMNIIKSNIIFAKQQIEDTIIINSTFVWTIILLIRIIIKIIDESIEIWNKIKNKINMTIPKIKDFKE